MMIRKKISPLSGLAMLVLIGTSPLISANPSTGEWSKKGPNVRILHENDGSRTIFKQSPDALTLVKRNENSTGTLRMLTVYRMNAYGDPLSCEISDGKGRLLFKVSYGYHKESRRLVAEDMFDAQVKRYVPGTTNIMPVRRIYYKYDAHGSRSKGIAFVLKKGELAEEVFRDELSTYPKQNPFKK